MLTRWGETLDKDTVLQEYPRPQLVRESYYNLNGLWDYAITASDACPSAWDGNILVPFSPEAPLSGVSRALKPGQVLWYRRTLPFGKQDGRRMLLHFGAADQRAWVYVNGLLAGAHTGGYTAFTLDITKLLQDGENVLTVAVRDDTDTVPSRAGSRRQSAAASGTRRRAASGRPSGRNRYRSIIYSRFCLPGTAGRTHPLDAHRVRAERRSN